MIALAYDTFRASGSFSRKETFRLCRRNRVFRAIATLRWWQSAGPVGRGFAAKAHALACQLAGMDLPLELEIGAGLSIQHGWGLVINKKAKIGRNVTLMHGVTIGRGDKIESNGQRAPGFPVIEDDVTIGPNASVVGPVTVGRGSRILPGAVVFDDVPRYALVGGNPGRVLKKEVPEDVWNKVSF